MPVTSLLLQYLGLPKVAFMNTRSIVQAAFMLVFLFLLWSISADEKLHDFGFKSTPSPTPSISLDISNCVFEPDTITRDCDIPFIEFLTSLVEDRIRPQVQDCVQGACSDSIYLNLRGNTLALDDFTSFQGVCNGNGDIVWELRFTVRDECDNTSSDSVLYTIVLLNEAGNSSNTTTCEGLTSIFPCGHQFQSPLLNDFFTDCITSTCSNSLFYVVMSPQMSADLDSIHSHPGIYTYDVYFVDLCNGVSVISWTFEIVSPVADCDINFNLEATCDTYIDVLTNLIQEIQACWSCDADLNSLGPRTGAAFCDGSALTVEGNIVTISENLQTIYLPFTLSFPEQTIPSSQDIANCIEDQTIILMCVDEYNLQDIRDQVLDYLRYSLEDCLGSCAGVIAWMLEESFMSVPECGISTYEVYGLSPCGDTIYTHQVILEIGRDINLPLGINRNLFPDLTICVNDNADTIIYEWIRARTSDADNPYFPLGKACEGYWSESLADKNVNLSNMTEWYPTCGDSVRLDVLVRELSCDDNGGEYVSFWIHAAPSVLTIEEECLPDRFFIEQNLCFDYGMSFEENADIAVSDWFDNTQLPDGRFIRDCISSSCSGFQTSVSFPGFDWRQLNEPEFCVSYTIPARISVFNACGDTIHLEELAFVVYKDLSPPVLDDCDFPPLVYQIMRCGLDRDQEILLELEAILNNFQGCFIDTCQGGDVELIHNFEPGSANTVSCVTRVDIRAQDCAGNISEDFIPLVFYNIGQEGNDCSSLELPNLTFPACVSQDYILEQLAIWEADNIQIIQNCLANDCIGTPLVVSNIGITLQEYGGSLPCGQRVEIEFRAFICPDEDNQFIQISFFGNVELQTEEHQLIQSCEPQSIGYVGCNPSGISQILIEIQQVLEERGQFILENCLTPTCPEGIQLDFTYEVVDGPEWVYSCSTGGFIMTVHFEFTDACSNTIYVLDGFPVYYLDDQPPVMPTTGQEIINLCGISTYSTDIDLLLCGAARDSAIQAEINSLTSLLQGCTTDLCSDEITIKNDWIPGTLPTACINQVNFWAEDCSGNRSDTLVLRFISIDAPIASDECVLEDLVVSCSHWVDNDLEVWNQSNIEAFTSCFTNDCHGVPIVSSNLPTLLALDLDLACSFTVSYTIDLGEFCGRIFRDVNVIVNPPSCAPDDLVLTCSYPWIIQPQINEWINTTSQSIQACFLASCGSTVSVGNNISYALSQAATSGLLYCGVSANFTVSNPCGGANIVYPVNIQFVKPDSLILCEGVVLDFDFEGETCSDRPLLSSVQLWDIQNISNISNCLGARCASNVEVNSNFSDVYQAESIQCGVTVTYMFSYVDCETEETIFGTTTAQINFQNDISSIELDLSNCVYPDTLFLPCGWTPGGDYDAAYEHWLFYAPIFASCIETDTSCFQTTIPACAGCWIYTLYTGTFSGNLDCGYEYGLRWFVKDCNEVEYDFAETHVMIGRGLSCGVTDTTYMRSFCEYDDPNAPITPSSITFSTEINNTAQQYFEDYLRSCTAHWCGTVIAEPTYDLTPIIDYFNNPDAINCPSFQIPVGLTIIQICDFVDNDTTVINYAFSINFSSNQFNSPDDLPALSDLMCEFEEEYAVQVSLCDPNGVDQIDSTVAIIDAAIRSCLSDNEWIGLDCSLFLRNDWDSNPTACPIVVSFWVENCEGVSGYDTLSFVINLLEASVDISNCSPNTHLFSCLPSEEQAEELLESLIEQDILDIRSCIQLTCGDPEDLSIIFFEDFNEQDENCPNQGFWAYGFHIIGPCGDTTTITGYRFTAQDTNPPMIDPSCEPFPVRFISCALDLTTEPFFVSFLNLVQEAGLYYRFNCMSDDCTPIEDLEFRYSYATEVGTIIPIVDNCTIEVSIWFEDCQGNVSETLPLTIRYEPSEDDLNITECNLPASGLTCDGDSLEMLQRFDLWISETSQCLSNHIEGICGLGTPMITNNGAAVWNSSDFCGTLPIEFYIQADCGINITLVRNVQFLAPSPVITEDPSKALVTWDCTYQSLSLDSLLNEWAADYISVSGLCSDPIFSFEIEPNLDFCTLGTYAVSFIVGDRCRENIIRVVGIIEIRDFTFLTCPDTLQISCGVAIGSSLDAWLSQLTVAGGCIDTVFTDYLPQQVNCQDTVSVQFTAVDLCGRSYSCNQVIIFENIEAPTIYCPESLTVQCDESNPQEQVDVWLGQLQILDLCSDLDTFYHDFETLTATCSQPQLVQFFVIDECGNSSTCTSSIEVESIGIPILWVDELPQDITIGCGETVPSMADLGASGGCGELQFSLSEGSMNESCQFITFRTWTVTDDCSGFLSHSQRVTVLLDNEPPSIIACPEDITLQDLNDLPADIPSTLVAVDNCATDLNYSFGDFSTGSGICGDPILITRTFVVSDVCSNSNTCIQNILVENTGGLSVRVYLEGALINTTAQSSLPPVKPLMRADLRMSPFTGLDYIPDTEPYTAHPKFTHIGGGGGENLPKISPLWTEVGDKAIVDWVFIELRDKTDATQVVATKSALLLRNGDIIDVNGSTCLSFPSLPPDEYHVAVRHRNHLGAMTADVFNISSGITVDFTNPSLSCWDYGFMPGIGDYTGMSRKTGPMSAHWSGYTALYMGNVDGNDQIKYAAPNDDQSPMFLEVLLSAANTAFVSNYNDAFGYLIGDVDLNSKVKYSAPNDDQSFVFIQLILYQLNSAFISNYNHLIEQIPK